MPEQRARRIPPEHFDLLKRSGILNPDLSVEQLITTAEELDGLWTEEEAFNSTLLGSWYLYQTSNDPGITDPVM